MKRLPQLVCPFDFKRMFDRTERRIWNRRTWEQINADETSPHSLFPPPGRQARFRPKQYDFDLDDVVGWSEFHVLLRLGHPDEMRAGAEWHADPTSKNIIVRDLAGNVTRAFGFGPVPRAIPPLQSYQAWFYHNVKGMTWKLYLTRTSRIPMLSWLLPQVVVEVYAYPTNAVF